MTPQAQVNPEAQARVRIDEMLEKAGWVVVDYADADFAAGTGVAIREFMTPNGPMDYLLVAERKVVGSIEAKREGETLRQVEVQADRYADGFEALVAAHHAGARALANELRRLYDGRDWDHEAYCAVEVVALALHSRDRIDPAVFDIVAGIWRSAMGPLPGDDA